MKIDLIKAAVDDLISTWLSEAREREQARGDTEDWRNSAERQKRNDRVNTFLFEYTEKGEGFSISYKTLKHHYFSWCRAMGLSDTEYDFSEILHMLLEKSLLRNGIEQPMTVIGLRMKHPVGLPRYYNKGNRKGMTTKVKEAVYAKLNSNGSMCALCGQPISTDDKVHIDHIIPVRLGGTNDTSNLQVVHDICNLTKG